MRAFALAAAALLALAVASSPALAAPAAGAKAKTACRDCHATFEKVLPPKHKPVKGNTLRACFECHEPDPAGPAEASGYSAGLHRAHATGEGKLDCNACHVLRGKAGVAIAGDRIALPATAAEMKKLREVSALWASGDWLDAAHGRAKVACAGCHGKGVPREGAEVDNERCLACHGPMDKLVAKSKPAVHEDRNPHVSHLGEIACTTCHKAHEASEVYCLDCHRKFEMRMPGARKP